MQRRLFPSAVINIWPHGSVLRPPCCYLHNICLVEAFHPSVCTHGNPKNCSRISERSRHQWQQSVPDCFSHTVEWSQSRIALNLHSFKVSAGGKSTDCKKKPGCTEVYVNTTLLSCWSATSVNSHSQHNMSFFLSIAVPIRLKEEDKNRTYLTICRYAAYRWSWYAKQLAASVGRLKPFQLHLIWDLQIG